MKNSDVTVKLYLKKHIAQKHTLKMTTLALVGGTVCREGKHWREASLLCWRGEIGHLQTSDG